MTKAATRQRTQGTGERRRDAGGGERVRRDEEVHGIHHHRAHDEAQRTAAHERQRQEQGQALEVEGQERSGILLRALAGREPGHHLHPVGLPPEDRGLGGFRGDRHRNRAEHDQGEGPTEHHLQGIEASVGGEVAPEHPDGRSRQQSGWRKRTNPKIAPASRNARA